MLLCDFRQVVLLLGWLHARIVRGPTVAMNELATQLQSAVQRMCGAGRKRPAEKQACLDATRFQRAAAEWGSRLSPAADDPWQVLEGKALRRHPDPLGALQRGEVPALMLRGFVPPRELERMLRRMAQMTMRIFSCRFPTNVSTRAIASISAARAVRRVSNDSFCRELNVHSAHAMLAWPHWCALLSHVEHDCAAAVAAAKRSGARDGGDDRPECVALRSKHPVFERCRRDYGRKRRTINVNKLKTDGHVRLAAREFGSKLYGNLQPASKHRFMRTTMAIDALHELMARGCTDRFCSPKQAMLAGVKELAGPSRTARQAQEPNGELHSPGTVRAMSTGWSTPLHMDSKHSSAFAALRKEICGEEVVLSMKTSPAEASKFKALTRHPFAASAILTLHAPTRGELNPFDLNIFRHRWPALLDKCSVRAADAYGVGARLHRETVPPQVLENPLTVRADPGDLFLFNSEFFQCARRDRIQPPSPCPLARAIRARAKDECPRFTLGSRSDTPRILGTSSRTVFNSFAGFGSEPGSAVEVYA